MPDVGSTQVRKTEQLSGDQAAETLLLLCSRLFPSQQAVSVTTQLLSAEISWRRFLSLAHQNEVIPSVYRNLCTFASGKIPADVLLYLKSEAQTVTANNFLLGSELLSILKIFSGQNIPVMPIKGPTLTVSLYGQLSGRQFGDLDILVSRAQVNHAKDLLLSAGYELFDENASCGEAALSSRDKHWVLRNKTTDVIVELHWALLPSAFRFRLDASTLWRSASSLSLLGEEVPCLGAEDQFLLLAAHGWGHGWESLKWICDIAELIRVHNDLNWTALLDRAEKLGCRKIALLALSLAVDLLDTQLPDTILREIDAEPHFARWVNDIRPKVLQIGASGVREPAEQIFTDAAHYRFLMQSRDRWSDRLALLQRAILDRVQPNAFDASYAPLPRSLSFMRWILRPVRLAKLYGLRAFTRPSQLLFRGLFR